MKKFLIALAAIMLSASLCSCFGDGPKNTEETSASTTDTTDITVRSEPPVTGEITATAETTKTVEPPVTAEITVVTEPPEVPKATTAVSVITEPPVNPYDDDPAMFDFALSDLSRYIILGKYLGMEVLVPAKEEVTDEAVDEYIDSIIESLPMQYMLANHTVEYGDKVNLDYRILVDGVVSEHGATEDYIVVIGDDMLAAGIEDGLVGAECGRTVNIKLPAGDGYYEELEDANIEFEVTVNFVYPTLDDDLVDACFGGGGVDSYRRSVRMSLEAVADTDYRVAKENAAFAKALANSYVIDYPEKAVEEELSSIKETYRQYAEQSSISYEDLFPVIYGISEEEAEKIMRDSAKNVVAERLLIYSIAVDMGIDVSNDNLEAQLAETARVLGLDGVDELLAVLGSSRSLLKEERLYSQIIPKIMAEAVFIESGK